MIVAAMGCRQEPSEEKRSIEINGSSSLEPAILHWIKNYPNAAGSSIDWKDTGSNDAIQSLIRGETDVAASSRRMTSRERFRVQELRVAEATETIVALGAVAVLVHPSNPVDALDLAALAKIYSGQASSWSEFGGKDAEITIHGRDKSSGTRAFFQKTVLGVRPIADSMIDHEEHAAIVDAVAADPNAVGFGPLRRLEGVKVLKVGTADRAPVGANAETLKSGAYPLSRSLFLYSRSDVDSVVREFLSYVISPEGQAALGPLGLQPAH